LELLVIDDELADICMRMMEGVNVDEETLAFDVIKRVATSPKMGSTFLSERHTRKFMKKELFIPQLIDRNRRSSWKKRGSKDIIERARDKVDELLKNFQPPETDSVLEQKLEGMIKEIEARPIDLYKQTEGFEGDSVTIDHAEIKADDDKK